MSGIEITSADVESIPLFGGLSADERARVAGASRSVQLGLGQVVLSEGELAFDFYAIMRGAAEVRRTSGHVARLEAGDVFGEMGVVAGETRRSTRRRGASVFITAPTDAMVIDGGDFRRLIEDIPALGDAVRAIVAERRRAEPS
jgi:CRP-like cAMP-binding protein